MPCGLGCSPRHTTHGVSPYFAPILTRTLGEWIPKYGEAKNIIWETIGSSVLVSKF